MASHLLAVESLSTTVGTRSSLGCLRQRAGCTDTRRLRAKSRKSRVTSENAQPHHREPSSRSIPMRHRKHRLEKQQQTKAITPMNTRKALIGYTHPLSGTSALVHLAAKANIVGCLAALADQSLLPLATSDIQQELGTLIKTLDKPKRVGIPAPFQPIK